MSDYLSPDDRGQNWAAFAATIFLVLGCFNLINGIVALANDDYFRADELLFGDLAMWAVFYLIIGGIQLLAGFLIFKGTVAGALIGITIAMLNAALALLSVGAYPVWALVILVLDGVVIYALTVYGTALRGN